MGARRAAYPSLDPYLGIPSLGAKTTTLTLGLHRTGQERS